MNKAWIKPEFNIKDVDKTRRNTKVGDKLIYTNHIKFSEDERIVIPKTEKVRVVKKYTHLVQVENPKRPDRGLRTMTYKEILFQKKGFIY